jgi:putative photosynthetic complex assembly protein
MTTGDWPVGTLSPQVEPEQGVQHIRRVSDRLMALIALGLLFVVAAVLLARTTDNIIVAEAPEGPITHARTLVFQDASEGRVVISDADTGEQLRTLSAGEGSFIRGVVRSLVRSRQQQGLFSQAPFQLNLHQGGRLQLIDPLTAETIDIGAFGPTNIAEFASLLPGSSSGTLPAEAT